MRQYSLGNNVMDECMEWANKAEALAGYARQIDDDTLIGFAKTTRWCGGAEKIGWISRGLLQRALIEPCWQRPADPRRLGAP
jgi:hypothetical protein